MWVCGGVGIFFFNDTATTEIYTLSLHDALPISTVAHWAAAVLYNGLGRYRDAREAAEADRKSTRLNSSHANISYAVFCLKKKTHHPTPLLPISSQSYSHPKECCASSC